MKINVIDLLNKIANGEEVPKKIKVGNKIYNYETFNIGKGDNYFTAEWEEVKGYRISYDGTYYYLEIRDYNLNEPVEILEEEPYVEICGRWFTKSEYDKLAHNEEEKKIPEKLIPTSLKGIDNLDEKIEIANIDTVSIIDTVNAIIDYFKSKGEE